MLENTEASVPALSTSVENENTSKEEGPIESTVDKKKETSPSYDLRKFSVTRILNNNTGRKSIVLLGTFPDIHDSDAAIVVLEKQAFRENEVKTSNTENANHVACYFSENLNANVEFINNIYGNFLCTFNGKLNALKASVIYPATEKHIEKYTIHQKFIISETPKLYKNITLPFIESSQFSLEWVFNILEHKQEVDRIVYEDEDPENGFVLLPDMKWDGKNVETLYLLAITHKRDIKSLRDLTSEHLPLLRNIRTQSAKAIEKHYGLLSTQLRMYFHYQPSFYHMHVHINPIRNDTPGIWCEKSHMLDTVISNLELIPDYYSRVTLPFVVYDGHKLFELYEQELGMCKAIKRHADNAKDETEPSEKQMKV